MGKVLIVDDVPSELAVLRRVVSELGHTVLEARDGKTALTMVADEGPDLVLLDIVLPRMDGFQVCRKITRNPATKGLPIVLISSKSQESDRFWGLKQGASEYFPKPIDPADLTELVQRYL